MKPILLMLCAMLLPMDVLAQTTPVQADGSRYVAMAGAGFGTTWDDEGLLGRGPGVSAGAGVRVGQHLSIVVLADRVSYYRDVEWLTFDGRIVFVGAEADARLGSRRVAPYLTFGAGVLNDSGVWIRKTQTGPSQPRVDERIERTGSRATMTGSSGIDIRVSPRMSLRGGIRLYGLLDTGDDLFPHVVIQPSAIAVVRF